MKFSVNFLFVLIVVTVFSCQNEKILTTNQQSNSSIKQDTLPKENSEIEKSNSKIGPAQSISKPNPPAENNGARPRP